MTIRPQDHLVVRALGAAVLALALVAGPARAQEEDKTVRPTPVRPGLRQPLRTPPKLPVSRPPPSNGAVPAPAAAAPPAPAPAPASPPPSTTAEHAEPEPGAPAEDDLYACKKYPSNARIKVTLRPETELKDLVTWVMGFTCRNFIYGTGLASRQGKVTIIAPSQMSPGDAYKVFLVALQTMGLTVVPKGKTLEIVETNRAKESPIPVYRPGQSPSSDQIVRVIVRPEHVSVEELRTVMDQIKSKDGTITPLPGSGVILVTDSGNSIDRMLEIARELDQPVGSEKIYIVKVHRANATELSQKLTDIFGGGAQGGGGRAPQVGTARPAPRPAGAKGGAPPMPSGGGNGDAEAGSVAPSRIIPDERTNSLIVVASERAYARILALVRRLDESGAGEGDGRIHVYYLENANAEEMAATLGALITGQAQPRTTPARSGGAAAGNPAPPPPPPTGGGGASGSAAAFEGQVRIAHDKPTNAIVIVSSSQDFLSMRDIIRKLDIPRRQVFVEATILEVAVDRTRSLGIGGHAGTTKSIGGKDSLIVGGLIHDQINTTAGLGGIKNPVGLLGGLFGPTIPGSEEIIGVSVPSLGLAFQMIQSNNDVNVLSAPHILTTDNEAAELSVGTNIPYTAGISGLGAAAASAGGVPGAALAGIQNVQRQDVALKIKLTPHVNESDHIRLELEQEINDIASENFSNLGPAWTKRAVKTTIVVKDQQPVVIGGLMQDRVTATESKVPLLGDLPLLGYLFKYSTKKKVKTNLLLFLTPYIIHDQADVQRIFEKKVQERREFVESFQALDPRNFRPDVNYRHKRGVVEEINKSVVSADQDDELYAETLRRTADQMEEGPVEIPPELRPQSPTPEPTPAPAPEPSPGPSGED